MSKLEATAADASEKVVQLEADLSAAKDAIAKLEVDAEEARTLEDGRRAEAEEDLAAREALEDQLAAALAESVAINEALPSDEEALKRMVSQLEVQLAEFQKLAAAQAAQEGERVAAVAALEAQFEEQAAALAAAVRSGKLQDEQIFELEDEMDEVQEAAEEAKTARAAAEADTAALKEVVARLEAEAEASRAFAAEQEAALEAHVQQAVRVEDAVDAMTSGERAAAAAAMSALESQLVEMEALEAHRAGHERQRIEAVQRMEQRVAELEAAGPRVPRAASHGSLDVQILQNDLDIANETIAQLRRHLPGRRSTLGLSAASSPTASFSVPNTQSPLHSPAHTCSVAGGAPPAVWDDESEEAVPVADAVALMETLRRAADVTSRQAYQALNAAQQDVRRLSKGAEEADGIRQDLEAAEKAAKVAEAKLVEAQAAHQAALEEAWQQSTAYHNESEGYRAASQGWEAEAGRLLQELEAKRVEAQEKEQWRVHAEFYKNEVAAKQEQVERLSREVGQARFDAVEERDKTERGELRSRIGELEKMLTAQTELLAAASPPRRRGGEEDTLGSVSDLSECSAASDDVLETLHLKEPKELRRLVKDLNEKERSLARRAEDLETKVEEAELECNDYQAQLNRAEADVTRLTEQLGEEVAKRTRQGAELAELSAAQHYRAPEGAAQTPEMAAMMLKVEGVVSDLKEELALVREEAARAKSEGEVLREREERWLQERRDINELTAACEAATAQAGVLETSLAAAEGERDAALKELAAAASKLLTTENLVKNLESPETSAKAIWESTASALRDKIGTLESEVELLTHKLAQATDTNAKADSRLHEYQDRYHAECAKVAQLAREAEEWEVKLQDRQAELERVEEDRARVLEELSHAQMDRETLSRREAHDDASVEVLRQEIARLNDELEVASERMEELGAADFEASKLLRVGEREADALRQELAEAQSEMARLEEDEADLQNTITVLTEELSEQRKVAASVGPADSAEMFALRIKCTQMEKQLEAFDGEEAALGGANAAAQRACSALAETEAVVLSERVATVMQGTSELLEMCAALRARAKQGAAKTTRPALVKLAKATEVLVRSLHRQMGAVDGYLESFTTFLAALPFAMVSPVDGAAEVEDVERDAMCAVILAHHRDVRCGGVDAACEVVSAARNELTGVLAAAVSDLAGEELHALAEELTQAREDSDNLWNPAATAAAAAPPPPAAPNGHDEEGAGALRRDLAKLKNENRRLYLLVKSLKGKAGEAARFD
eukprot:TRINITY_DN297_c0_g1_i14.p1 TRINITY_DN297_c0_g1~~TRINITY_DN297_c0_g1_i14.p1  ORF type:complete len:1260 (+),score=633.16 TRINITY_DN297_c0_g1_i14:3808-7587(+)